MTVGSDAYICILIPILVLSVNYYGALRVIARFYVVARRYFNPNSNISLPRVFIVRAKVSPV